MRVTRILNEEQEFISRFLAVLGRGIVVASHSKTGKPGFFLYASNFIHEYLEPNYLSKEEVLLKALEDAGFPTDEGPVGRMRSDHAKSREAAGMLSEASRAWQGGDEGGRADAIWASSEYTDLMRNHFERLKNLVFPLLEQTVTPEGEQRIAEALNRIEFSTHEAGAPDKYLKIVQMLEEEVKDWES
ncbi:MAG TPA: hemerythrin domain-containing protein [Anaerolineales bacterium]|nr:hemerythrin domain-containing protein [Anaerolineales bacterium]